MGSYCILVFVLEPSPEPEHLEQSGETVSVFDQALPECVCVHWTALPAQVTTVSSLVVELLQDRLLSSVSLVGRRLMGNSTFDIKF